MILYLNQRYLTDPKIQNLLHGHDLDISNIEIGRSRWDPGTPSLYTRKGQDNLFFSSNLKTVPGFSMPDYDPVFSKSWTEVMDERCSSLYKFKYDKSWVIAWSGGIDSTGIMVSIIRNIPRTDWHNITVACNQFSVWENPKFFLEYIQPYFKIIDSAETIFSAATDDSVYVINGEPADQLFSGAISQAMMSKYGRNYLEKNPITDAGLMIDYMANSNGRNQGTPPDWQFAEWYYECLITNVQSQDVPINTFHDLLWWSYFNFSWISVKIRGVAYGDWGDSPSISPYLQRCIHWFDTDDFQQWAMHNNDLEKYGESVGDYKKAAKKYIFDLDHNKYYFKYKTKTHSGTHIMRTQNPWCCISDDLNVLRLDRDWDTISQWLPHHINNCART